MGCRPFDAIPVVDSSLARFVIDVEILEIVVKINAAGTEVATKERCVSGEDSSHVDMSFAQEGDCKTGLPFVEMGYDCYVQRSCNVLSSREVKTIVRKRRGRY